MAATIQGGVPKRKKKEYLFLWYFVRHKEIYFSIYFMQPHVSQWPEWGLVPPAEPRRGFILWTIRSTPGAGGRSQFVLSHMPNGELDECPTLLGLVRTREVEHRYRVENQQSLPLLLPIPWIYHKQRTCKSSLYISSYNKNQPVKDLDWRTSAPLTFQSF